MRVHNPFLADIENAGSRLDAGEGSGEINDVAKTLGEDIIFGRLAPGARLIEDQLIERFGVTRHYIRCALSELEKTGIVIREKNKGVAVRSLTEKEVREIYEVREVLQRQAALRISLPAPRHIVGNLEKIHAKYTHNMKSGDFFGVHKANDLFHISLFSACGNDHLVESIRYYMWLSLPVRAKKTTDITHLLNSEREHYAMIRMLSGTDSWALAQICVDHLQSAKQDYLHSIESIRGNAGNA